MAQNNSAQERQSQEAKARYLRYFMIDFLEFNMRKVLVENTSYCAERCKVFDGVNTSTQVDPKQEKQLLSCFEKCLGKFSDSYDSALDVFGNHLKTLNTNQVFRHSEVDEKKFLLGQGGLEPVYDKPRTRKRDLD